MALRAIDSAAASMSREIASVYTVDPQKQTMASRKLTTSRPSKPDGIRSLLIRWSWIILVRHATGGSRALAVAEARSDDRASDPGATLKEHAKDWLDGAV